MVSVAAFVLIFGFDDVTYKILVLHFTAAIVLNYAIIMLLKDFSVGAVCVVAPVANAYAIVTVIGSVIFLNLSLTLTSWLAVLITIVGITLLTYKKDGLRSVKDFKKSIVFSVASMIAYGMGFVLFDLAIADQRWHQGFIVFQSWIYWWQLLCMLCGCERPHESNKKCIENAFGLRRFCSCRSWNRWIICGDK